MDFEKFLIDSGIDAAKAKEIAGKLSSEIPKSFMPKDKFNEVNDQVKDLKTQISDRDKQLKDLGEKAKGNEDLTKQITDLQDANKKAKEDSDLKIKNITMDNAIKLKLKDSNAKYEDLLLSKVDKSKLIVADDGSITGLDDQIKTLQTGYKDLFGETVPAGGGGNPAGGGGNLPKDPNNMTMEEYATWFKERNK
jgi:hypothetical protein